MAADYWASFSSATLVSQQHLLQSHREDRARGLSEGQAQHLKAHFVQQIWELARLCKLRYRVAATASVYFRRFYVRNSFTGSSQDPRLVHVGCLYLASKTEETLLQAKHLIVYAKRAQPTWPYEVKHLLDSEMVITQELDFMLVVYHPYHPLVQMRESGGVPAHVFQRAWAAANDLYRCDACIMYAPHVLALGCVLYAWAALQPTATESVEAPSGAGQGEWDCVQWLEGMNVDTEQVVQVTEHLTRLYEDLSTYTMTTEDCKRLLQSLQAVSSQATSGSG